MGSGGNKTETSSSKRIVVKIGSSTVVGSDGALNDTVMEDLVSQVAALSLEGHEVILVSSGAVACGRTLVSRDLDATLTGKQVLSALGQPVLMRYYDSLFSKHDMIVAQILLTREDFAVEKRSNLCRSTLQHLLSKRLVPIVNENDTIAVEEIVLGDNDTLSAQVALMVSADLLVLLTDIDGLYTQDPRTVSTAKVIRHVDGTTPDVMAMAGPSRSIQGTGGMVTKVRAAVLASERGTPTVIANGSEKGVLQRILKGEEVGTYFGRSKAV